MICYIRRGALITSILRIFLVHRGHTERASSDVLGYQKEPFRLWRLLQRFFFVLGDEPLHAVIKLREMSLIFFRSPMNHSPMATALRRQSPGTPLGMACSPNMGDEGHPGGVRNRCLARAMQSPLWFIGDRKNINRHFAELYDGIAAHHRAQKKISGTSTLDKKYSKNRGDQLLRDGPHDSPGDVGAASPPNDVPDMSNRGVSDG